MYPGRKGFAFKGQSCVLFFTCSLVISLARLLASYSMMNKIHLASLRTLASQARVMVDVVCAMGSILPAYHTSYDYAKAVFLSFIEQAGRRVAENQVSFPG